ncbi:hypothetical protein [Nocardia sp. NPDC050710]|uniref:hypothetical protein n=1 Tax=Nocardia sp. NPDC050710 TaxID=3157220 RepID=UPI003401E6D5
MGRYRVRKVHSCEHCGTEEEPLGTYMALDHAKSAAETDAHCSLRWDRFDNDWPLTADPEDGIWRYLIEQIADQPGGLPLYR